MGFVFREKSGLLREMVHTKQGKFFHTEQHNFNKNKRYRARMQTHTHTRRHNAKESSSAALLQPQKRRRKVILLKMKLCLVKLSLPFFFFLGVCVLRIRDVLICYFGPCCVYATILYIHITLRAQCRCATVIMHVFVVK